MVKTRPVTPADRTFLYELYASTRRDEMAAWGWSDTQQAAFLQMQFQAQSRAYEWEWPEASHHLIVNDGGQPIGRLFVARAAEEMRLVDIALLPECRGTGTGTSLIRELQAAAAAAGLPLRLSVATTNPAARRLYARLGFQISGETGAYYAMEWRPAGAPAANQL